MARRETHWRDLAINKQCSGVERIFYLFVLIWSNINIVIYIVLNTKSTRFKQWVIDILIGYQILDQYKNASIFILSNRFYKESEKAHKYLQEANPEGGSKSELLSLQEESFINNDYMKNFKTALVNERLSKKNFKALN